MTILTPQQWYDRALTAERNGDTATAKQIILDGVAQHPGVAAIWNSAGNLFLRNGNNEEAERHFAEAVRLEPDTIDFSINRAVALSALGDHVTALMQLELFAEQGVRSALYCSVRGTAERAIGNTAQAALWYDRALSIEPNRTKALHGRARVALDRGEAAALQLFDRALARNNGDADLWLGKAQSLDVAGNHAGARQIAEALVKQAPQWTEGLKFLAQLRLAQGDPDFTSHYGECAKIVPQDPNILSEWCSVLSGLDFTERAAEIAAEAQVQFPAIDHFILLEAVNAGAAGDQPRAERAFARMDRQDPERWVHETRHRIRLGEYERADQLLSQIVDVDPWSISAWALRGVVWRLTADERSEWLDGSGKLAGMVRLHGADSILPKIVPLLHELHDQSPLPLGQSLRGGTQTRGILFDRMEPEFAELRDAISATVDDYRTELPPFDAAHPLLRHRDTAWKLAGSWSVRLTGGGDFHTAHIHPLGIVSSALYLETPDISHDHDLQAGWLELGRPAADLGLDLGPIKTFEPKPGYLALFPSTLYHGTRPFTSGRRLTTAFDVTPIQGHSR